MDKIEDLSQTENAVGKTVEPVTIDDEDYETLDIDDPLVWLYLDKEESQGLMNADFLEFFTI
mgnify:CR=1 FL=1